MTASGTQPRMPFVVSQANLLTIVVIGAIQGTVLFFLPRLASDVGIAIGLAFSFLPLLLWFALVPFNPYRGYFGHIERDATGDQPVSERERRLLVAFYDPSNRRRAAGALAIALALWVAIWRLGRLFSPPLLRPEPISQTAAVTFVFSIGVAVFAGFFGLTSAIRRRWPGVVEVGFEWPEKLKYPGSLKASARSLLTGQLPSFLSNEEPSR